MIQQCFTQNYGVVIRRGLDACLDKILFVYLDFMRWLSLEPIYEVVTLCYLKHGVYADELMSVDKLRRVTCNVWHAIVTVTMWSDLLF